MTVGNCESLEDVRDILNELIIKYTKELNFNEEELLQMFKDHLKSEIVFEEGKNLTFYKDLLQEKFAAKCKDIAKFNFNNDNLSDLDKYNIMNLENAGKLISSGELIRLKKHLVYQKRLKKMDCDSSIQVVQKLHHFIGNAYYYENQKSILNDLFETAIKLYLCNKQYLPKVILDNEVESMVKSIEYLEKYHVRYDIFQENIKFTDDSEKLIHNILENKINHIGGLKFLSLLFKDEIYPTYNIKMDRYLIHRNKKTYLHGEKIKKRIPYNYLIQISLKHLTNGVVCLTDYGNKNLYLEIIEISKCYFNALNLQSYSNYEDLLMDYKDLPLQISKNMLFEKMFILEQYKSNFIQKVLEYLYKPFFKTTRPREYSFKEYLCVTKYILEKSSYCQTYSFEEIKKKTNVKLKKLQEILEDISNPKEIINSSFNDLLSRTNFREKPLIKLENNQFFLLDSRFCGFAFCEVMYQILKENIKNLDVEQGHLIEKMIYDFLDKKRIPYKYGKYEEGNSQEGECDLVLENTKYVIFIEIKKRPLPETFEECDDIALYRTLAGGMVRAQKQSLRHKNYLQSNGKMKLTFQIFDKLNKESIIQLNDRRVVCISICLPEYTFLTNKVISQKVLESLLTVTYHARDEKREKELNAINKISEEIRELVFGSNDDKQHIFHNTLFRSMQQFLVALENSNNIDSFFDNLLEPIYIIDGSGDCYVQLASQIQRENSYARV